jgi:hypothetical protein
MDAPFEMSPEAERHLRERLAQRPPAGMEPSLTRALRSQVRDRFGNAVENCDFEHYFIGYDRPEKHTGFYRLRFGSLELAMSPSSIDSLRGRRLSIQQVARVDNTSESREILIAIPLDATTRTS